MVNILKILCVYSILMKFCYKILQKLFFTLPRDKLALNLNKSEVKSYQV